MLYQLSHVRVGTRIADRSRSARWRRTRRAPVAQPVALDQTGPVARLRRRIDVFAVVAGTIRLASGVSFLVAPEAANRLWGDPEETTATASLLLRSMGYRDALVGGLLLVSGLRGAPTTAGWFLASAGADAADLLGGVANRDRMTSDQHRRGIGGAAVGVGVGLLGAARAARRR